MHVMLRLRQVVIAARDLEATVDRLCADLGLTVCFTDPSVAEFGLHNALLTVGDQFIEVVSPIADGTAAGRLLDRRQAAVTAYMVMFEVDDLDERMAALDAAGVRIVWSGDLATIRGRHLHPGRHRRGDRQPRRDQSPGIVALGRTELEGPRRQQRRQRDRRLHDRHRRPSRRGRTMGAVRADPLCAIHRRSESSEIELLATDRDAARSNHRPRPGDAAPGVTSSWPSAGS